MSKTIYVITSAFSLASCSGQSAKESAPFEIATTEAKAVEAMSSRYEIEAWESYGIPGSPDADVRVPEARTILQQIVDDCGLGRSILIEANHGVITLHPSDDFLDMEQVVCARSFEKPGLIFRDKKAN